MHLSGSNKLRKKKTSNLDVKKETSRRYSLPPSSRFVLSLFWWSGEKTFHSARSQFAVSEYNVKANYIFELRDLLFRLFSQTDTGTLLRTCLIQPRLIWGLCLYLSESQCKVMCLHVVDLLTSWQTECVFKQRQRHSVGNYCILFIS